MSPVLPSLPRVCAPLMMTGKVNGKKTTRQPYPISRLSSGSYFFPEWQPGRHRSLDTDGEELKGTRQSPHLQCRHKCRKKRALPCGTFSGFTSVSPIQPSASSALPLAAVLFSCHTFLSGNFPSHLLCLSGATLALTFSFHTFSQADGSFSTHFKYSVI